MRGIFWAAIVVLAGGGLAGALLGGSQINVSAPPAAPAASVATIDKSIALQADRRKLIQEMVDAGIFQKVEMPGTVPHVWARPAFYGLEFDRKQSLVGVIYAYHFDGSNAGDLVRLFDSRSGKEIGTYGAAGLRLN